jgi:hypothetical protein
MDEVNFTDPSNSKKFHDAYRHMYEVITAPDDFQDVGRAVRPPQDQIFEQIREAEKQIVRVSKMDFKQRVM